MIPVVLVLVMLSAWLARAARAQGVTGAVEGWVADSARLPLDEVTVTAVTPGGRRLGRTTTDPRGHFRLGALPVGTCAVVLRRVGYGPVRVERVAVRLGATVTLGVIRLRPGAVTLPSVLVLGPGPLVDMTTTAGGGNLQSEVFEALPVERHLHALPALLPQANASDFGEGVNIAGSSGLENVQYVDGVNVTDPYRAGAGGNLPSNFVSEVAVRTGGYEPEFGRALGGVVNVVTKSGGNDFRGEGFGYFSHSALGGDWRRGLADANVDARAEYDAGVSLGGPIARNRMWFFVAYSHAVTTRDLQVPGFPSQRDSRRAHLFAAKVTWRPAARTRVALTVLGDPATGRPVAPAFTAYGAPTGLDNLEPFLGESRQGGVAVSLRARQRLSRGLLLESVVTRAQRDEVRHGGTVRARREPLIMDLETGRWSGGFGDNSDHHAVRWAGKAALAWSTSAHTVKAGIEYEDNRVDAATHFTDPGIVIRLGATMYQSVYLITSGTVHNRVVSAFLQDSWLLAPSLRLNVGLRWDGQHLVGADRKVAQRITDGFQPRIGVLVRPGRSRSKLFASLARYYEQLPLFGSATWWHVPVRNGVYFFDRDPRLGAAPLDSLDAGSHGILPEVSGLRGQHLDEVTAGFERALGTRMKVGFRGVFRTLREVIEDGLAPGTRERILGNPGRGRLGFLPRPWREYWAVEAAFEWRGDGPFVLAGSYTLSRNRGNYAGLYDYHVDFPSPNGATDPDLAEQAPHAGGPLPNDRPHVLKVFGAHRSDFGLTTGVVFLWQSGTPISEFGASSLPAHFVLLRPRGGVGRTPSVADLSVRLAWDVLHRRDGPVRPRAVLDLLHVASARRAVTVDQVRYSALDPEGNQTAPNPNYLKPTRHQPPMLARLGVTVEF